MNSSNNQEPQHKPRYKPGIDINAVRPEYRYLFEDFCQEEKVVSEAKRQGAFSLDGIWIYLTLITLCSYFAFGIFTHPNSYGCYRGRCIHSYSAGICYVAVIGVVAWVGLRGFYMRFFRK